MFHVKHARRKGTSYAKELALIEEILGRSLSTSERELWRAYMALFEEWSRRTNLVSAADRERWVERHVKPSLELGHRLGFPVSDVVLDLGTGAGFPGVPLALVYPETEFVLVDAKRWRVLFLDELVATLRLANVRVELQRVEDPDFQARWHGEFAIVLARAVADLRTLWLWSRSLLKEGGFLATVKGAEEAKEELRELRKECGEEVKVEEDVVDKRKGSLLVKVAKRRKEVVA